MIDAAQRIDFLERIHLFDKVEGDLLVLIAPKIQEEVVPAGQVIISQGEDNDRFFMIYSGSVTLERRKKRGNPVMEKRVKGDFFGEEIVLKHRPSRVTVTAAEETLLLVLSRAELERPVKESRLLKSNFAVAASRHRLAHDVQFSWLREGEIIYFLTREHPFVLFRALLAPFLLGVIAFLGLAAGFTIQKAWLLWPSVAGLGLIIGWGFWRWVEWKNCFNIVTDQRVVWLEKMVGVYDSRREVPLPAIQRVTVQMEFWGQQLDCGDLTVRTIVGSTLTLYEVPHPYQAAALIEEHWKRLKEVSLSKNAMEEEAMRQALRERLLRKQPAPDPIPLLVERPVSKKEDLSARPRGFSNIFRLRLEGMSTITYRKHWIVLLEKTWFPNLIFLALIGGLAYEIIHGVDILLLVWFSVLILVILWWYYLYSDWSNDIFQVTPDQILDIYKKPLGEVTSDIAPLDNILHLEYERKGLLRMIFNYGNVHITIGGGKDMTFKDVFNPSAVQDDIERRRLERLAQKEQETIKAERERAADWFAAYHRSQGELREARDERGEPDETGVK